MRNQDQELLRGFLWRAADRNGNRDNLLREDIF